MGWDWWDWFGSEWDYTRRRTEGLLDRWEMFMGCVFVVLAFRFWFVFVFEFLFFVSWILIYDGDEHEAGWGGARRSLGDNVTVGLRRWDWIGLGDEGAL